MADAAKIISWTQHTITVDEVWEKAYQEFETPDEEIAKFKKRLSKLGAESWPKNARIVELFCGRGNGLVALEECGFTSLEGVDMSEPLLKHYSGCATLYHGDCRELHFEDQSKDLVIVQGGLHHLPRIPEDLEKVFLEVRRILQPDGQFLFVEPWKTPFLRIVHFACSIPLLTSFWRKLGALQRMIERECDTYFRWLDSGEQILSVLEKNFVPLQWEASYGKIFSVGRLRSMQSPR